MIYRTQHDTDLVQSFVMQYPPNGKGPFQLFQFPPKITSNNMSGDFSELGDGQKTPGIYPAYAYGGPNERSWTCETTYIIEGGGFWNNARVKQEVQKYRQYYFTLRKFFDDQTALIYFNMWGLGGQEYGHAFMRNLSIKHSSTMIIPPEGQDLKSDVVISGTNSDKASVKNTESTKRLEKLQLAYPLRTDVSWELVYWANFKPTTDTKANRKVFPQEWF